MRFARSALGATIIGLAVAAAWHLWPSPQRFGEQAEAVDVAPSQGDAAAQVATPGAVGVEAPSHAASLLGQPIAGAMPSATTPTPAPLPGETAVTPMVQVVESWRHVPQGRRPDLERVREKEHAFAAEPVDETWAPGAEADLLGKIAETPGLALTGLRVECRSTMCRMQLTVPASALRSALQSAPINFEQAVRFADSVGLELDQALGGADASGTLQSVTYLRRKGAEEPP